MQLVLVFIVPCRPLTHDGNCHPWKANGLGLGKPLVVSSVRLPEHEHSVREDASFSDGDGFQLVNGSSCGQDHDWT